MLAEALELARKNIAVFPLIPRGKIPAIARGFIAATTNEIIISKWWTDNPDLNIGARTGKASDLFVVDIDNAEAEAALRRLEDQHGELPPTVEAITTKGRHLYFTYPRKRTVGCSVGKIAPGIDIRSDGGYVVAPPSIHPSGKRYCWSVDGEDAFAAPPEWLVDLAAGQSNKDQPVNKTAWHAFVAEGADEGCRNDRLTRLAGHLIGNPFLDPRVARELIHSWNLTRCRPPLPKGDVETILNSIARREVGKHAREG